MTGLLQISDPHFGTERPQVVEALLQLVRDQAPEVVVMSGDITQRARRRQFDAAHAFVQRLGPVPLLAVPGNHDLPLFNLLARLCWPYAQHRRVFGPDLEPVHAGAGWLIIGVKTTRRRRHKDGEVSDEQIERTVRQLKAARPEQLRVVVLHHPIAVCREQDAENLLHNREAAIERWSQAGADVVMGGHIHLPYAVPLHEAEGGLPRRLWAVQAGTALSSRVRHEAGNSVNLLRRVGPGATAALLERWDFDEAVGTFRVVSVNQLALSRSDGVV